MVYSLLFIAASFLLGTSICRHLSMLRLIEERVIFSLITGIASAVWIAYVIALLRGSVDDVTIFATVVLCVFISFLLRMPSVHTGRREMSQMNALRRGASRAHSAICISLMIYAAMMNLCCVLRPDNGSLYAMHSVWGDYPFHASIITSFVYGKNFPPFYPQFPEKPMHYPFLVDFLSAVLMRGGIDLRTSILLPNIMLHTCLLSSFFFLSRMLSGSHHVAAISTLLLIFTGYPPFDEHHISFLNPIYAVFLPQRSAILGFSISFLIYMLLFHALADARAENAEGCKSPQRRIELFVAGALAGMLPYIHAHSFIVVSFVSIFLTIIHIISGGERADIIYLVAPLITLSSPQVIAIRSQVSDAFFSFHPGWTDANNRVISSLDWSNLSALVSIGIAILMMLNFWGLNLNLLAFLIPIGFIYARRALKVFYIPFLIDFIAANLIKFQPWYWDNYKILLHWYAISIILAASAMLMIYERIHERIHERVRNAAAGGDRVKNDDATKDDEVTDDEAKNDEAKDETARWHNSVLGALISMLVTCTMFGIATHIYMFEEQAVLWSRADFDVASWIIENTPPDAIFLAAGGSIAHNHPVPALAGRRIPLGYSGWLWSHGFNWSEIQQKERDVIEMFRGNTSLLSKYEIDYICVGPFEEEFARMHGFSMNVTGELIYDRVLHAEHGREERWRIYAVSAT